MRQERQLVIGNVTRN